MDSGAPLKLTVEEAERDGLERQTRREDEILVQYLTENATAETDRGGAARPVECQKEQGPHIPSTSLTEGAQCFQACQACSFYSVAACLSRNLETLQWKSVSWSVEKKRDTFSARNVRRTMQVLHLSTRAVQRPDLAGPT